MDVINLFVLLHRKRIFPKVFSMVPGDDWRRALQINKTIEIETSGIENGVSFPDNHGYCTRRVVEKLIKHYSIS